MVGFDSICQWDQGMHGLKKDADISWWEILLPAEMQMFIIMPALKESPLYCCIH